MVEGVITDKNDYLNITILDCLNRIKYLEQFKLDLVQLREIYTPSTNDNKADNKKKFADLRSKINQSLLLAEEYIATTYVPVTIQWKAPMSMTYVDASLFRELFNPQIAEHIINSSIDHLDMALGRYKSVCFKSFIHTISPLYWMRRFSFWITYSLLNLFNIQVSERKFSVIRFCIDILTIIGTLATIYGALATYYGNPKLWF